VETINLARPAHRDYALALCLADYEQDHAGVTTTTAARSSTPSPGLTSGIIVIHLAAIYLSYHNVLVWLANYVIQ
jgi:hypothetical protein